MQKLKLSILGTALAVVFASAVSAQDISVLKNHDTEQPMTVVSEGMRIKQKEGLGFLTGSVLITQGNMEFAADQMVIFYDSEGGFDNPSIHRLDATGGVKLNSATETVTAEWGVYDVPRRLVTLGGKVDYKSGSIELRGERLELDLVSGAIRLDGEVKGGESRVRGVFSVPKADDKP